MTLVAACRGARPGLARGLGGREGHTARGPGGSSQLLNHGGIYLANKFNDQFVLVTVALPQINYSKFKYNHWLVLTQLGMAAIHSERGEPPGPAPPASRAPRTHLRATPRPGQLCSRKDPGPSAWGRSLQPEPGGRQAQPSRRPHGPLPGSPRCAERPRKDPDPGQPRGPPSLRCQGSLSSVSRKGCPAAGAKGWEERPFGDKETNLHTSPQQPGVSCPALVECWPRVPGPRSLRSAERNEPVPSSGGTSPSRCRPKSLDKIGLKGFL